jgi:hypothetical protein
MQTNSSTTNYTSYNHGPTNTAQQAVGPSTPRAKLRLARGARRRNTETPPRSRAGRPLGRDSASLEGYAHPRAGLRLARGSRGSAATGPLRRAHSPDRSIKCSDTPRAPESKSNPRHAGPLTPPGNHIPALFRQPY